MQMTLILVSLLTIGFVSRVKSGKGCGNNPADIVFVLDESTSIHGADFTKQLDFVEDTIETFDVQFDRTHVGVLTYSTENRVIFHLGQYTGEKDLKNAVKAIVQRGGNTYTHLALKRLREEMFSKKHTRSRVRHIAIVITDGESQYPKETEAEARLCHEAGLQVFAIGVGPKVMQRELDAIASDPDLVFRVDSYAALATLRQTLASRTCRAPSTVKTTTTRAPTPAPVIPIQGCTGQKVMDHIWSISYQANFAEINLVIDFIKSVTLEMTINPKRIQVGVAPRFCDEISGIRLKDHDTGKGFRLWLEKRRLSVIRTERTIEYIRKEGFSYANGGRYGSVKYGILIVDNRLENWEQTLAEAQRAKKEGIQLIVIGVGDRVQQDQLRLLCSSSSHYFYARSYSALADLKSKIIQKFCEGITTTKYNIKTLRGYLEQF